VSADIIQRPDPKTTPNRDVKQPKLGDWFWVKERDYNWETKKHEECEYLKCITHIGTNYVEVTGPGGSSTRVHFDEFDKVCRAEPEADKFIETAIEGCRHELKKLMGRIKELTASLAIAPQGELAPQQETATLVLHTSTTTMKDYKKALVKAEKEQLPALFEKIKKTNERMAMWMKAPMLPMEAQVGTLDGSIDAIKQRVFNVELYAGLVEEIAEIKKGDPAPTDEKIHLMQRQHYMDEECLVDYKHGGMEFKNFHQFNKWLAKKENFERVFPFPRCAVSFRVRRNRKNRRDLNMWISIQLGKQDDYTFLYMRNGEQLFVLATELDFGAKLFPDLDRNVLSYGGVLWAKDARYGRASSIKRLITDDEREGMKEELEKQKRALTKFKREQAKLPETTDKNENGRRGHALYCAESRVDSARRALGDYEKFTPESVYFDDISEYVRARMLEHNRLVLVLQGLLDRSLVFHPHPQYKLWERDGYEAALKLVYDKSRTLAAGDKPSFKTYVEKLQESINVGSVVIGQEDAWMKREAERENNRYRSGGRRGNLDRYRPYSDPGPGLVARVSEISRDKSRVTFRWQRERQAYSRNYYSGRYISCKIIVPTAKLFNVSAYKPDDYKIFYNDPRSRAEYLDWALFLLTAEDYHAGKIELSRPGEHQSAHDLDFPAEPGEMIEDKDDDGDDD
jgi:hypothetical protein